MPVKSSNSIPGGCLDVIFYINVTLLLFSLNAWGYVWL